jgi:hypothetical protein
MNRNLSCGYTAITLSQGRITVQDGHLARRHHSLVSASLSRFTTSSRAIGRSPSASRIPCSSVFGGPLAAAILETMEGVRGLHAWQWCKTIAS